MKRFSFHKIPSYRNKLIIAIIVLTSLIILNQCGSDKKEFTIWIGGSPEEIDFWQTMINDYQDSANVNIQLVRQPTYSDQRRQNLIISLQAKQPNPDLFLMDVVWINQFYRSGWLVSLDKYISKSKLSENIFFQKGLDLVDSYDDSLYALPVFMDVALLYYRKDLLDKYGIAEVPKTWNDLVKDCEIVMKGERKSNPNFNGFVWQGAQYEGLVCVFTEFIYSNGGGIKTDGTVEINNKKNIDALHYMQELIHKYKISPENVYTEMKEEEVRRSFQKGNALFERNWTYAAKLHNANDSKVKGKFGISELPHFKDGKSVSTLGGWHIGISKYSDVKEEAWKFIEYAVSYKFQKKMIMDIGWNPARKDIYKDEDVIQKIPYVKIMEKVFLNAVSRPNLPFYPQVSEVIQRNVNNCLAGNISAKKAIEKMQNEIDELVSVYEDN